MSTISERLKEERKRLELNQEDMGHKGGVKRGAQINYESGTRCPDGRYYAAIAAAGADVQYILTGVEGYKPEQPSVLQTAHQQRYIDAVNKAAESNIKTDTVSVLDTPTVEYLPTASHHDSHRNTAETLPGYTSDQLSRREAALLDNYRNTPDEEGQKAIEHVALLASRANREQSKATGTRGKNKIRK